MTNSLNLFEENLKYKIFCLFHYNNSNFFISSNEFIYHYEFKENNLLERNKIYISNDIIKYALYDSNTDRIYGMNNSTLTIYCLKKRKKIYQFHHFNKIIVDKYRYIYFPPKKFLQILQSLFFSFFSTKNHIKKCCSIIWTHLHNLNFKSRFFVLKSDSSQLYSYVSGFGIGSPSTSGCNSKKLP